jgi:hypothetical protein
VHGNAFPAQRIGTGFQGRAVAALQHENGLSAAVQQPGGAKAGSPQAKHHCGLL